MIKTAYRQSSPVSPAGLALASALLLGTSPFAFAADIDAASRIERVTLYPDGAVITRSFTLDLAAGSHEIRLSDLPASLDPASLKVEGGADAKVLISAVDVQPQPKNPQKLAENATKLKTLKEARERLQDKLDASEGRKAMILRLAQPQEGKEARLLDVEGWIKASEAVGKGLQTVNEEMRGLRNALARLDEESAALQPPADEAMPEPLRRVVLAVEAGANTKASLTLTYRVEGASWQPVYEARLETRGAKPALEITRRALVQQKTGEDWADIALRLSTLAVARGTAAPPLNGERIGFDEPPRPMPMARIEAQQKADMAMRQAAPFAVEEPGAPVEATPYQAEFVVPGRISLPSGEGEKNLRLAQESIEPRLTLKTVPVLDPTAYLEAGFTLKTDAPLLAGEVSLTRDGAFIGKANVEQAAPGAPIRLGFGADDRITIKRVPVSREGKEPSLLGSTRSDEVRFRVDVTNLHGFPVEISILERQPVSEEQLITVERLPDMTKPDLETVEDQRGVFAWLATLKPQEMKRFTNAYRLRWPQGKTTRITPLP